MVGGQMLGNGRRMRALNAALGIFGAGTLVVEAVHGAGREIPDLRGAERESEDDTTFEIDFIPVGNVMSLRVLLSYAKRPEITGWMLDDVLSFRMNGVRLTSPILNAGLFGSCSDVTKGRSLTATLKVVMPVKAGEVNTLRVGAARDADPARQGLPAADLVGARTDLVQDNAVTQVDGVPVTPRALSRGGLLFLAQAEGAEQGEGPTVPKLRISPHEGRNDPGGGGHAVAGHIANVAEIADPAFTVVSRLPCFARGTRIRTPEGERPVEALSRGDMVETRDHGPRPLRWVASHHEAAIGDFAPVAIAAGAFGVVRRPLVVAGPHRVFPGSRAGETVDRGVVARDLVRAGEARVVEGGMVEYFHLLFDDDQVIWAEGLATESYLSGPRVVGGCRNVAPDHRVRDALDPLLLTEQDREAARESPGRD